MRPQVFTTSYSHLELTLCVYLWYPSRATQFATRATLLSTEALKSRGLFADAALQLIRMTSEVWQPIGDMSISQPRSYVMWHVSDLWRKAQWAHRNKIVQAVDHSSEWDTTVHFLVQYSNPSIKLFCTLRYPKPESCVVAQNSFQAGKSWASPC